MGCANNGQAHNAITGSRTRRFITMVLTNCTAVSGFMKRVITAVDIPAAGELRVPTGSIVTASAREVAAARGVRIVELPEDQLQRARAARQDHRHRRGPRRLPAEGGAEAASRGPRPAGPRRRRERGEAGRLSRISRSKSPNWWPSGTAARGVIIDGAGIGSSIAANKVPGIRAALCYDKASARNSREHNDSNVLTLGARLLTETQAEDVLRTWLATPFAGGRHQARVQKILDIEQQYLKKATS